MLSFTALYHPIEVQHHYDTWQASCGPCALAAVVREPLTMVRAYFPGIETRGYVNPTHMQAALHAARRAYRRSDACARESLALDYGLAFLCFTGPWTRPGVPIAASYQRSHWIGVAVCREYGRMIYDVNASALLSPQGAWVPQAWWQAEVLPHLVAAYAKADGGYLCRWACAVWTPEPEGEAMRRQELSCDRGAEGPP